jgi:RHS repeat-associated protein
VTDPTGIVRKLIDPETNTIFLEINCDIFGNNISDDIPYAYRGKRFDPETGYLYFGRRYYDPRKHRWTSPDPLGPIDHENLFQYVYNNPLQFSDPTGCSFWGYLAGIGEIAAGCVIIAGGAALELATIGGFTIGLGITTSTGAALIGHGLVQTSRHAQDIHLPHSINNVFKNDPGCPQSREVQDKQFQDAIKEIEKLLDKDRRKLHDHISGQNFGYHEIIEEGYWLFND